MPSYSKLRKKSKSQGRSFLKYAELPPGTREITVKVLSAREIPTVDSPLILDIDPNITADGKPAIVQASSIAVNFTNLAVLAGIVGDELSAIEHGTVTFRFSLRSNPAAKGYDDAEVMGYDLVGAQLAQPATFPAPVQMPAPAPTPAEVKPPKKAS